MGGARKGALSGLVQILKEKAGREDARRPAARAREEKLGKPRAIRACGPGCALHDGVFERRSNPFRKADLAAARKWMARVVSPSTRRLLFFACLVCFHCHPDSE